MPNVKPKKALGQHFLTDLDVAARIASTVSGFDGTVVEVGPGMGVLTQFLVKDHPDKVTVVEIDGESVDWLRDNFPALPADDILATDFLRLDLDSIDPGHPIAVIGNYPYNISSQIFFHILDYRDKVPLCSGMLQREVAERLAAPPGTKARGILSVLLQAWYDVEYLFTVSEHVFNPPPKVKSGVIKLTRNGVTDLGCDERTFKAVVKATFGQRRKTLRNSLRGLLPPGCQLSDDMPLLAMRPEQLSVQDFITLTRFVSSLRGDS